MPSIAPRNAPPKTILFVALSLSIGWGIRGNFGHEYGAAIPGAFAAMAVVLVSGREDWWRRVAYFGAFGAVGWAFGGSISYMQVIAYTHSGDSLTVIYGFACLFVIGFLWAAMGGAATALSAFLTRERLTEFFAPLIAFFLTLWAKDIFEERVISVNSTFRQNDPLYWYDSDWLAALLAILVALGFVAYRRQIDKAVSLILHMAVGWWMAFLIFPVALTIRMTPPRGDNWAGCLGMVIGMIVYFQRNGLAGITFVSLVTGFIGGLGFATATLFKLIELKAGWQTNYHSILEQTYGLINGVGVAVAFLLIRNRAPKVADEPSVRRWTEVVAVGFLLFFLTYVNLQKDPDDWIKARAIAESMYFLSTRGWFDLGYAALAAAGLWLICSHLRRPIAIVPPTWLGKGQMLFIVLLWWMVIGNLAKAIVAFTPQRLVTEGTIFCNALLCTVMALLWPRRAEPETHKEHAGYSPLIRKTLMIGAVGAVLSTVVDWGIARTIYGDKFAGSAGLHIRFGPNATATTRKPGANAPHP
jgi:hypothetical protein